MIAQELIDKLLNDPTAQVVINVHDQPAYPGMNTNTAKYDGIEIDYRGGDWELKTTHRYA